MFRHKCLWTSLCGGPPLLLCHSRLLVSRVSLLLLTLTQDHASADHMIQIPFSLTLFSLIIENGKKNLAGDLKIFALGPKSGHRFCGKNLVLLIFFLLSYAPSVWAVDFDQAYGSL